MKNQNDNFLIKRLLIDPALRRYKRQLESQIDRDIEAGTFDRELSARVDAVLLLLSR